MYMYIIYKCVYGVYACICIYEQKFIMAEIMRMHMRMFKVLLTSVSVKIQ